MGNTSSLHPPFWTPLREVAEDLQHSFGREALFRQERSPFPPAVHKRQSSSGFLDSTLGQGNDSTAFSTYSVPFSNAYLIFFGAPSLSRVRNPCGHANQICVSLFCPILPTRLDHSPPRTPADIERSARLDPPKSRVLVGSSPLIPAHLPLTVPPLKTCIRASLYLNAWIPDTRSRALVFQPVILFCKK